MSNRFRSFSTNTAPIALGKQTVRFAPEFLRYVSENGFFPEDTDQRGDFLLLQFVLPNGAKTASFEEVRAGKKFEDAVKLHFDGKFAGDGYAMKRTFEEVRKMDKRYKNMPAEDILFDLLNKEFTVYFYRYETGKRSYLQVAWNAEEYARHTGRPAKKAAAPKNKAAEEELPFELDF